MVIHEGEQYQIPIKLTTSDGTVITPANCSDVRMQLGATLKTYSAGELFFDSTDNVWCYPILQNETLKFDANVPFEVSIKFSNGEVIKSFTRMIRVASTIMKEAWT